jgi:hypothetical protein
VALAIRVGSSALPARYKRALGSDVFEGWISEEAKLFAIQTDLDEIVFYVSDDLPDGEDHERRRGGSCASAVLWV